MLAGAARLVVELGVALWSRRLGAVTDHPPGAVVLSQFHTVGVELVVLQLDRRLYEQFYNERRAHRSLQAVAPLRALPETVIDPWGIARLDMRRHDRLSGMIHEYQHAA
ncbi:hypothetical protein ACFU6I_38800 [Streptomyces sp. NPDC057486]|uniref:hypothetical protein n=1 Tax=Streptomyces sp. NPDC057486 TaxID=3346145 RepID=UPI0036B53A5C